VGSLTAEPNTPNVIAGAVVFSLDVRHVDAHVLEGFTTALLSQIAEKAARRSLRCEISVGLTIEPAVMNVAMQSLIAQSCAHRGLLAHSMPSGAGHDAQVISAVCPTAMIFVPSRQGISHSPLEFTPHPALCAGLDVLTDVLYQLAWKGNPS
jgi:allantoate deiminase